MRVSSHHSAQKKGHIYPFLGTCGGGRKQIIRFSYGLVQTFIHTYSRRYSLGVVWIGGALDLGIERVKFGVIMFGYSLSYEGFPSGIVSA